MSATSDQPGLFKLAALSKHRRRVRADQLRWKIINQETKAAHYHIGPWLDAEPAGDLTWRRGRCNLEDFLPRRMTLFPHLGVEAGPPFFLVPAVVVRCQL